MSNPAPQAWAWGYSLPHDPFHPPRPGHFPVPQSVAPVYDHFHAPVHALVHAPPMPSLGMPTGIQTQVAAPQQGPARVQAQVPNVPPAPPQTYDQRQAPEHLRPTNGSPTGQGGPGVPARQAVPSQRNSPAGPQTNTQAHAANGNPSNQYLPPTGYAPPGPQAQGYVANSNHPTQYMQVNTSPATHPQDYQGRPAYPIAPQATQLPFQHPPATPGHPPPPINMDRNPSQGMDMGGDGQSSDQTYAHIIENNLLPEAYRPTAYQGIDRTHQRTGAIFNGGSSPMYMPPRNVGYQAPRPGPPARPRSQGTSRYDLPPSRPMPPQPDDNDRIAATQPRPINGGLPQPGSMPPSGNVQHPHSTLHNNMPPQGNMYAASNTPHSNMHRPATHQPNMKRNAKRPADQPPRKQPAKRQKKSEPDPVAPAQQHPEPAADANPAISQPVAPAQQLPEPIADANPATSQPVADANPVIPDKLASPEELQIVEPPHLPWIELQNIKTQFVVDPCPEQHILPGETVLSWNAAIEAIFKLIRNCEEGSALRLEPLASLRELCDAIEWFIAHPGRRELLPHEPAQLLNVRFIRVIEDGIWDEMFDAIPARDYDTVPAETKERVVAEVWEKRRREWPGPSLQEAQRQIFKYDRPDLLGLTNRQPEPDPEE